MRSREKKEEDAILLKEAREREGESPRGPRHPAFPRSLERCVALNHSFHSFEKILTTGRRPTRKQKESKTDAHRDIDETAKSAGQRQRQRRGTSFLRIKAIFRENERKRGRNRKAERRPKGEEDDQDPLSSHGPRDASLCLSPF